jgi:hypothetical protein
VKLKPINPDIAKIIMIVITLIVPSGIYFWSVHGLHEDVRYIEVSIHAIIWGIMPEGASGAGISFLDPYVTARGIFYGIFNIWFCIEVIRFSNDYTRRKAVFVSGLLSILYPFFWTILALPFFLQYAAFTYVGPIPIQQAIGFALMKLSGVSEPKSPWSEPQTNNSDAYDVE